MTKIIAIVSSRLGSPQVINFRSFTTNLHNLGLSNKEITGYLDYIRDNTAFFLKNSAVLSQFGLTSWDSHISIRVYLIDPMMFIETIV